jgi:hypothetical protein
MFWLVNGCIYLSEAPVADTGICEGGVVEAQVAKLPEADGFLHVLGGVFFI